MFRGHTMDCIYIQWISLRYTCHQLCWLTECFHNHKGCIFERWGKEQLYCSNTEHLQFCHNHSSPAAFNHSYCISTRMVCDGINDCRNQEEESDCVDVSCPSYSSYHLDEVCVHSVLSPSNVTSGHIIQWFITHWQWLISISQSSICHSCWPI